MSVSRRDCLFLGAIAPLLVSCATDLTKYSTEPVAELAAKLGVCMAAYVTLSAGTPNNPVLVSGCVPAQDEYSNPVFQAASLTKPVIAYAALKLVRDGQLDLSMPVSHYLPGGYSHRQNPFSGTKASKFDAVPASTLARIPVGTLLNHSSGLPNWTSGLLSPQFAAGERWQYSGEGYVLLQHILAAISGQDIESFITKTVFGPLDMQHSRLRLTDDIRKLCVSGTSLSGTTQQFDFLEANAAASMYTTAKDYAKFLSALLADKVLLSLVVSKPVSTEPKLGLGWGYGWGIETAAGGPYLWQWGNNPGFRTFAMVSTSSKNGFILFTNHERGMPLAASLAYSTVPAEHGVFRFDMLS
jgi:CubicO group peptidase (beta-lactamase class C family)